VHAVGGEAARWQADYGWTTVAIPPHSSFFSFSKLLTISYGNFKNLQHESCSK
jgi:hypothetical protein